ncbi:MAG: phosphatidate cytidylyltransferase, partial [Cyanobacteria bacterium J083]
LLAWWFNIPRTIIILASVIAAIIALISYFLPILPSVNSVGRKSLGTFFYAISIGVLAALFWQNCPQCTVIGVLTMTWGDGMAAIIGQKFGTHLYQVRGITKSWEGSTAMILVSYLVISLVWGLSLGYSWQVALFACLVAVVATCLETFSLFGIDNLTVPLASGILTYFLMQI